MSTPEQIAKLPKWAQEHIRAIHRERDIAVRELNEWVDNQTPAKFSTDELLSLGENRTASTNGPSFKKRYFTTDRIMCEHAGIRIEIGTSDKDSISLSWGAGAHSHGDAAFIPTSYQQAKIVSPKKLRE